MSWWKGKERALYQKARSQVDRAKYARAIQTCHELLESVADDAAKTAYVQGTLLAIALRHLGHDIPAKAAFEEAYNLALSAKAFAIAAYIRNDQASMEQPADAIATVKQALAHLAKASRTPVPGRNLKYDRDFFYAILALHLNRNGDYEEARQVMAEAKKGLVAASRTGPVYQQCYLLALQYELTEFRDGVSPQQHIERAKALLKEIAKQRKTIATLRIAQRRIKQLLKARH